MKKNKESCYSDTNNFNNKEKGTYKLIKEAKNLHQKGISPKTNYQSFKNTASPITDNEYEITSEIEEEK